MKIRFNLEMEIIKDKDNEEVVDISIKSKDLSEYILKRDQLINDKIYTDNYELILMKNNHDKKLDSVRLKIFEELYFNVGKCEAFAAKVLKEEMKNFYEQQAIKDQQNEAERQLMLNEIKELKKQNIEIQNQLKK